jgi:hypothetical protein
LVERRRVVDFLRGVIRAGSRVGEVSYNTVHSYALPALLAAGAVAAHRGAALPYAIIWCAHVAFDRALGFGLKYPDAFVHTHLGMIGKAASTTQPN